MLRRTHQSRRPCARRCRDRFGPERPGGRESARRRRLGRRRAGGATRAGRRRPQWRGHGSRVRLGPVQRLLPGWRQLYGQWQDLGPDLISALFTPFPPVRAGFRLARGLGLAGGLRFARFAMLPVRRLADETFTGAGGGLLLAGNALHTDLSPESAASAIYGWLLASLGQQVGFPVPEGGAGRLTDALVRRFTSRGGRLHCDSTVTRVTVRRGRAVTRVTVESQCS